MAGLEGETSNALFEILDERNAQLKHADVEHLLEVGDSFEDLPNEGGPDLGGPSL